jgi:hypothetical protein
MVHIHRHTQTCIYIYNIVNIHTSLFLFQLDLMISCYFMLFHENFSALLPRPNCSGCHFVTCETAHKVQCEKVTEELTLKFCWYCFAFAAQTMWAQQWIAMACTASMIFHAFQDILSLSQPCQGWLSVVCPSDVRMHKSWKAIRGRHAGSTCDLWYEYHELLAYSLKGTFTLDRPTNITSTSMQSLLICILSSCAHRQSHKRI